MSFLRICEDLVFSARSKNGHDETEEIMWMSDSVADFR